MASKGRDGDSMLVHMTPGEVHGLQALAMKHGGSLTVNPDTGLPEANFLKSLLPILAGFALGPAGFGLVSSAMGASAIVGGITGIATGSLSKGLMAGLGAYGGFGIGEGLIGAGAGTAASNAAAMGVEGAATGAGSQAAMLAEQNAGFGAEGLTRLADSAKVAAGATPSTTGMLSTGFDAALKDPMAFAKQNWKPIAAAALPVLSDIGTTTPGQAPTPMSPGRIREKRWDGRQFVDVASTDANVYNTSGRSYSDLYRGYKDGGGIVALAEGGVPGYAVGGAMPNMREWMDKTGITDPTEASNLLYGVVGSNKDTRDWGSIMSSADPVAAAKAATSQMYTSPTGNAGYVKLDNTGTSGMLYSGSGVPLTSDLSRADEFGIAYTPPAATGLAALNTGATNTGATNTAGATSAGAAYAAANNVNVGANINKWIQDNPFATAADINNAIKAAGLTPADVNPYLTANTNISDATRYALSHASEMPGAGGLAGMQSNIMKGFATPNLTQAQIDTHQARYGISDDDIKSPLSGGSQIPAADMAKAANYLADPMNVDVRAWINSAEGKAYLAANPQFDINDIAYTHYQRYGKYEGRKWEEPAKKTTTTTTNTNTNTNTNTATGRGTDVINATQNTGTNVTVPTDLYTAPASSLPVGVSGNTGPSQIGGGATVNPNGTITTSPRIPGIPVGGFTGSQNLRDTYTKGGGSLGYTSPTFKTIEEFNAKYLNRMGGDSKAAYDYLTGKGGAKYPTKSGVGRISEAYDEAVLGYPARGNLPYIYNKATGKMDVNPDYVAPGRDSAGNVTYSMSLNDIKKSLTDTPMSGQALYDWAISNNLSAQQIADATGRSLSSVYSDFRAGSKAAAKKKEDDKAAGINTLVDNSSAGGSDGGGGGGGSGTGPGGVGGAGGPASTTASESIGPAADAVDAVGGYYSRGKLNYRAKNMAMGGATGYALGGLGTLGGYSDGGRLLKGPGDGVSDSIPATIGRKQQPARLADGEFVVPARIVSELGNGSTDAGAKKLYAMLDRVQRARGKTTGKNKVAANSRADKYLPA